MAITGHGGSQANERGCPKQQRGWVGVGTAAAQHFSNQAAHGLDSIGGERQAEIRVCQVRAIERQIHQKLAKRGFDAQCSAIAA